MKKSIERDFATSFLYKIFLHDQEEYGKRLWLKDNHFLFVCMCVIGVLRLRLLGL